MKITTAKSGRIIVELDGYSEGYKAYIQGAITGKVSFPANYTNESADTLEDMAKDCLADIAAGTENVKYFGAKIIKKANKVR